MQTNFSLTQLAQADIQEADAILRACVHCGFCTATCPTYVLLGDELDSPRGRIYLIKSLLEQDQAPTPAVVKHLDRCLTCLSCMTTCPSGVQYQHLVEIGRDHVERHHRRPRRERLLRGLLARVLPNPRLFRLALSGGRWARPFARLVPDARLRAMLALAPWRLPKASSLQRPQVFPAAGGQPQARMALMTGCAQQVLAPAINEATIRFLTRHGVEVVVAAGAGCCGALVQHMGDADTARRQAAANIEAWWRETTDGGGPGLDAVVINTSGCGVTVKDYGFLFRADPTLQAKAARIGALARDLSEVAAELDLKTTEPSLRAGLTVAYHSACSMQHGQRLRTGPQALLRAAGFVVKEVPESHLCCGSAGVYNMLQPELATQLRDRKLGHIERTGADLVAAGNLGCLVQIGSGTDLPVLHTVQLLDWATGGPRPEGL